MLKLWEYQKIKPSVKEQFNVFFLLFNVIFGLFGHEEDVIKKYGNTYRQNFSFFNSEKK